MKCIISSNYNLWQLSFSNEVLKFYKLLPSEMDLPDGVSLIYPFTKMEIWKLMEGFYNKYYNDNNARILLLGINPGRFGAGITGIPFTDPFHLDMYCKIDNDLDKRKEQSSIFIYDLIMKMGGPEIFYKKVFISSVCPLGFIKDKKNYNYYDSMELYGLVKAFIVESIFSQLQFPCSRKIAFSLGKGKNYKIIQKLNDEYKWFDRIEALPHPRWVIQYQKKNYDLHLNSISGKIKEYLD